jgi:6-phosphogluconolactonase
VSNRGDDTITTYKIVRREGAAPALEMVGITPTEGATPRHFQFAAGGRYVIAANQDSNSLTSFSLDVETGALVFTGHSLGVNAPNFVCSQPRTLHKVKGSNSESEI